MQGRRLQPRVLVTSALAMVAVMCAPLAQADDALCIAPSEQGLQLRRAGKLHEALAQFANCAAPSCPDEVKTECASRIADVKAAMPTLILAATDGAGNDLRDVQVRLDGAPLVSSLDGQPVAIDPGSHTLRFEQAGQPPVEKTLVLREGEKNRRESVVIGPPPAQTATTAAPETAPHPSWWTTQRTLAVVGAGLGVAGLAVGGVFGAFALSDKNQEQSNCGASACPNQPQAKADYDTGNQNATVSTIAFVAGGAFLAAGAVLFFTARDPAPSPASGSLYLAPSTTGRGPGLVLGGSL
jgi:hypothetical protein